MKSAFILIALAIAAPAFAEPVTRTSTYDGVNYDGSRTTVRDPAAGTLSRDAQVTRASDGAIATRSFDRQRTDTSVSGSATATSFRGKTRTGSYTRSRGGRRF